MKEKRYYVIANLISLIECLLVIAFFLCIVLCGGAEYQTTEEAFDHQFWSCGIAALGCIGGVGILEAIRYAVE